MEEDFLKTHIGEEATVSVYGKIFASNAKILNFNIREVLVESSGKIILFPRNLIIIVFDQ